MTRTVKIGAMADIFAAVPHLLGFVPHRSFVLIVVGSDPLQPNRTEMVARVSLEQLAEDPTALAQQLTHRVLDRPVREIIGLAVCPPPPDTDSALPYRTEILALTHAIRQLGFCVNEVGHVPDFIEGARWRSYFDKERTGQLPDPFATPLAAAVVSEGFVTARSRGELASAFIPADPHDRIRLEPYIASALRQSRADQALPNAARDRLTRADVAIAAAANGALPTQDVEIADLIATFSVEPFRSATFSVDSTDLLRGVQGLTTYLWRFAHEPCASHLAAVAGLHAYLLGESVRAGIAANAGTVCLPLLVLLRRIVDAQLPPQELRVVTSEGAAEARAHLTGLTPTSAEPPATADRAGETADHLSPE
ncbi:DUF4192 domain-containing protein [Amycolatopsis japonica]|uniref:DUF4192 domain-containing protein n=1 Tax=Amycolatopsis japonica TaxID=208439 RepID=UPI00366A85D2